MSSNKGKPMKSFKDLGKALGHEGPKNNERYQQNAQPSPKVSNKITTPKDVPEFMKKETDYVKIAEQNMTSLLETDRRGNKTYGSLTTSKIRNILTVVNEIYNDVVIQQDKDIADETRERILYMKVRLAYEAGREPKVKQFVERTGLLDAIDYIGTSKESFIRYARYLEALVAYHRFYGGRDN